MFYVTFFSGDHRNVSNGEVIEYNTLAEMGEQFKIPNKGKKLNGYFVRGECKPLYRRDTCIAESQILVIDGDKSYNGDNAPPPYALHNALCNLNVNHFIYTTHSHEGSEKNKYRCVLMSDRAMVKPELRSTLDTLMAAVTEEGCQLAHVTEMNTWSQPWFIPTRDDPSDGLFEFYEYYDGINWPVSDEPIKKKGTKASNKEIPAGSGASNPESKPMDQRISEIISGESFHDNLRDFAWMMIKDGASPTFVISFIKGLMNNSNEKGSERWQGRYNDIDRIVNGAMNGIEDSDDNEIEIEHDGDLIPDNPLYVPIPKAPGMMGELMDDCYNMQYYPYWEVALVSVLGMMSGICGRKFNYKEIGMNTYSSLIMETGMGKDSIRSFIVGVYDAISDPGEQPSYFRLTRVTGPKALYNSLLNARSQVALFSEAGLLLSTAVGDPGGASRFTLDLYTRSAKGQCTGLEGYSDEADSMAPIASPAFSFINESTPKVLLQALQKNNSEENGDLGRQTIVRFSGDKPKMNRNRLPMVRQSIISKLSKIHKMCSAIQALNDYDVAQLYTDTDPDLQEEIDSFSDVMGEKYNVAKGRDYLKASMLSRAHVKAVKYAGLASILNRDDYSSIGKEEWEWAKAMTLYELETVETFFAPRPQDNILEYVAITFMVPAIKRLLSNSYATVKPGLKKQNLDKESFTRNSIAQILKNNRHIMNLNDDPKMRSNPVSGIDKVLNHMVAIGYIKELSEYSFQSQASKYKKAVYKVTKAFHMLGNLR